MSYRNNCDKIVQVAQLEYAQANEVRALLKNLKKIQFNLQSQRTQAIQLLDGLETESDFFANNDNCTPRFPVNKRYVCVQYGDWPFKFEQVRSAANYKAPDIASTNKDMASNSTNFQSNQTSNKKNGQGGDSNHAPDDANKCITSMNERDRFEKALKAYHTGIADMETQLKDSIWNRSIFEKKFDGNWG